MQTYRFLTIFSVAAVIFVAGCSETTSPSGNVGIPRGSFEGEYGFSLNGNTYDSGTPFGTEGSVTLWPLVGQRQGAVQLFISLYFQLPDGTYGSVRLFVPLADPGPQTAEISSYTIPANSNATASINYDSLGVHWYSSLPGGTITLTKFDTVKNLVSGTFNFAASQTSPTSDLNNVMSVASGYFNDIPIVEGAYGQGSVTATVNALRFSADTSGREMVFAAVDQGKLFLTALGQGPLRNSEIEIGEIPLALGSYKAEGPTSLNDTSLSMIYWSPTNVEISTADPVSSARVTITSVDVPGRRISGTFDFTGMDTLGHSVAISNGVIDNVHWEP